ncbi:MAG: MarR family transcriptional regulator [Pseudomonadota bacterium]
MNNPLDLCLTLSHAHASLTLKLDDVLGTLHGLSYNDFLLLTLLSRAEDGRMAVADLVRPLGVQLSAVTRQLVLLEKTGLAQREPEVAADGRRHVAIRSGGKKLLNGATVTAAAVCADLVHTLPANTLPDVNETLQLIRRSDVLDL